MEEILNALVSIADSLGYVGVYLYTLLVGTFIPVPSEIVLLPSGYLASHGDKSFALLLLSASLGSLSGALVNYFFAKIIMKKVLYKKRNSLAYIIRFFKKHGKISVFLAPLTPGLGQYISLPAGISHMKLRYFIPITYSANIIWVGFMLLVGYAYGDNQSQSHTAVLYGTLGLLGFVIMASGVYVWLKFRSNT